jgi:hypothetical protein
LIVFIVARAIQNLIYILIQTIDIEVKKAKIKSRPVKGGLDKIR